MFFRRRLERYRKINPDTLSDEKLGEIRDSLERRDRPALLLSAFLTLFLPVVLILLSIVGVAWLLFC